MMWIVDMIFSGKAQMDGGPIVKDVINNYTSGGSRRIQAGVQQTRAPSKFWYAMSSFLIQFCIRMLQNKAPEDSIERASKTLELPGPLTLIRLGYFGPWTTTGRGGHDGALLRSRPWIAAIAAN